MNRYISRMMCMLLLTLVGQSVKAQGKLIFDTPQNRVGEILFQQPHTVVFSYKNKGNKPVVIADVKPSCGCTQVEWKRAPIQAGEKGQITAVYDAKMLGTFHKELAVYVHGATEPTYLEMDGRVVANMLDYTGDFPYDMGNVRTNINRLEFLDVNRGDKPVLEFQIFNKERTPYRPELMHLPAYLSVETFPEVIAGGRTGKVRVTLDSEKIFMLGLNETDIYVARYTGDKISDKTKIKVYAVLLPEVSHHTEEERVLEPKMTLSKTVFDMGKMKKSKQSDELTITNTGKSTLDISKVQVFNHALVVELGNKTLEPGKSTTLKVTVKAKELKKRKNEAQPRVLLITNDPSSSKLTINVNVEPK